MDWGGWLWFVIDVLSRSWAGPLPMERRCGGTGRAIRKSSAGLMKRHAISITIPDKSVFTEICAARQKSPQRPEERRPKPRLPQSHRFNN